MTISKNGQPVVVVTSAEAFEEQQRIKVEFLRREIGKGLDDIKRWEVVSTEDAFAAVGPELEG